MTTSGMRKQLISYVENADNKKIKGLYSLLEDNLAGLPAHALTNEQLGFLKKERTKHLDGTSKSYSWEEIKGMVKNRIAS